LTDIFGARVLISANGIIYGVTGATPLEANIVCGAEVTIVAGTFDIYCGAANTFFTQGRCTLIVVSANSVVRNMYTAAARRQT